MLSCPGGERASIIAKSLDSLGLTLLAQRALAGPQQAELARQGQRV